MLQQTERSTTVLSYCALALFLAAELMVLLSARTLYRLPSPLAPIDAFGLPIVLAVPWLVGRRCISKLQRQRAIEPRSVPSFDVPSQINSLVIFAYALFMMTFAWMMNTRLSE
jgi:hypothetical protein